MTAGGPMFRKLLLTALLLTLVTVVPLDFLLTRYTARRETESAQRRLLAQARVLTAEVVSLPRQDLNAWIREAERRSRTRVTLIAADGRVLADSQHDAVSMENHAGRPEVLAAVAGREGVAVRWSLTLKRNLVYTAVPVTLRDGERCVLRLAVPLEEVDAAVAEVRSRIIQVSLGAVLVALVIAFLASRGLSRRIRNVERFAGNLVAARFSEELPPGPNDELGALGRSLNGMATQLRELVEGLRVESARREAILGSMVEGVLAVDHELCVTFCNEAFMRAVGAPSPVSARLPVLELVRDPEFLEILTRTLVSGKPQRERLQLVAADNRAFSVQTAPLALRSGRGAVAILHDVSDIERLERVRRDFVANVSHELRTPLAAIHGYAETLLEGAIDDPEHNRKFVGVIKAHAARLANIASDLLALSELEAGPPAPETERISVRDAADAALEGIASEASLRKVRVVVGEIQEAWVAGQRRSLEQVLGNLLDNAVKFNRANGEVRVEVRLGFEGETVITVADTGIGIPSEDLPRIFERFYRVDKARSREVGGTGLGLSIVKHAVERMGGSIRVESELGKGSKFVVTLPAVRNN